MKHNKIKGREFSHQKNAEWLQKNSFVYFTFFLMSMQKYLIFCVKHLSHNGQTIMLCMDRQKIGILCVCVSAYVYEDGEGGRKFLLLN